MSNTKQPDGLEEILNDLEIDLKAVVYGTTEPAKNHALTRLRSYIEQEKAKAIEDFRKNVDTFEYEYDKGERYLQRRKLRGQDE